MKYIIHACPARMWYVDGILVPDMKKQGIKASDIIVWNDSDGLGNLQSWLASCQYILDKYGNEPGIWHLQDDVVIASTFKAEAEKADNMIVNGFVSIKFNKIRYTLKGEQRVLNHWNSFPCMYIPMKYINGFLKWWDKVGQFDPNYQSRIEENKADDYLFWAYMRRVRRLDHVINLAPNIADHIDYMMGGSVVNPQRTENAVSAWWEEPELLAELPGRIEALKKQEQKPEAEAEAAKTNRTPSKKRSTASKSPSTTKAEELPKKEPKPRKTQNKRPTKAEEKEA